MPGSVEAAAAPRAEQAEPSFEKLKPGPGKSRAEVAKHQRARIHSAMLDLVASGGFDAVTVREITCRAGVSSRAFYEHFDGTEDCLLRTYDLIARRAAMRIVAAQSGERDWRERLYLAFDAFTREIIREPQAARYALIEAYAAGPEALNRVRHAETVFEAMLIESFARAPGNTSVSPLLIKGIVAGAAGVARTRLLQNRDAEIPAIGARLTEWALSLHGHNHTTDDFLPIPSSKGRGGDDEARAPSDARDLIISAAAKLAATRGYDHLTVTRIHHAAGVPPRAFLACFDGVEDCFFAVLRSQVDSAIADARRALECGFSLEDGIYRAIASLCERVVNDQVFTQVCFVDTFAPRWKADLGRQYFIEALIRLVVSDESGLTAFDCEVFTNAIWGVLRHYAASEQARQLPSMAGTLASLFPLLVRSNDVAIHITQHEHAEEMKNRMLAPLTDLPVSIHLHSVRPPPCNRNYKVRGQGHYEPQKTWT